MRRLWIVLALALILAIPGCALLVLLETDWGRARVCAYANEQVSAGIMGSLQIERIEEIDLPFVRATGVKLVAPDGVPAIDVVKAEIQLDYDAIRHGRFAWHRAVVDGGIVRVTEDERGRVNMAETFRGRSSPDDDAQKAESEPKTGASPLDLRSMVTSGMTLVIGGGSLPKLRMVNLHGIMRVEVKADGQTQIRFDEYRGNFVEGLPTGRLDFEDVKGHVQTDTKRLLRFEGRGQSEGEPVVFDLDIFREPTKVHIGARFPKLAAESLATMAFGAFTKFTRNLELDVSRGEGKP